MVNRAKYYIHEIPEGYEARIEGNKVIIELAESEDERIINAIIGILKNSNAIDINVSQEKMFAWLEKQKENAKSAISIPSDCTANAKCENSWHKVADSLPDNPREVLCKDEAGNFFIGRYYVGEGWEISNYDDEDKLHDLNPPVSKWIDFPSEKQKEQKEIPLMNDDADLYFDEWNQQNQNPTKRQCFEEGIRYAQRLQKEQNLIMANSPQLKEQKQEWSEEDELTIADLINYFEGDSLECSAEEMVQRIKSLCPQQKQNWSEEDERKRQACITTINEVIDYERERWEDYNPGKPYRPILKYDEQIDWLKSLRPQPHWKPTEEQMKHLQRAINCYESDWGENKLLRSLIYDLKKLM